MTVTISNQAATTISNFPRVQDRLPSGLACLQICRVSCSSRKPLDAKSADDKKRGLNAMRLYIRSRIIRISDNIKYRHSISAALHVVYK